MLLLITSADLESKVCATGKVIFYDDCVIYLYCKYVDFTCLTLRFDVKPLLCNVGYMNPCLWLWVTHEDPS